LEKERNLPAGAKRKNSRLFSQTKAKKISRNKNETILFSFLADVKREQQPKAVSSATRDYNCDLFLLLERKKKFLSGFFPRNRSL
jgi:hypothetical protein